MTEVLGQLRWQDGLDISIIWYLIYRLLQMLRGSRAMQMMIGLAVILMSYVSIPRSWSVHAQLDLR